MRWAGFRKVRGQVCKRIRRRLRELELDDLDGYRAYLEGHEDEWGELDALCRIPISRFFRDHALFEALAEEWRGRESVRCWSAGCAAGEEPYSLAILRRHALPDLHLDVLATDDAPHQLERARAAVYSASSLKEVPGAWRDAAFTAGFALRHTYREGIRFELQDLREAMPDGPFDLILCRYLAFTYFDETLQREILAGLAARLAPDGILAIGRHERLPEPVPSVRVLP